MRSRKNQTSPYYAYCILRLEPDQGFEVFDGIDERPVFPVREGRLAMVVSRLERNFRPDAQSIVQHGRVVHRVFQQHTVLPFRFGTIFESEPQVRHVLLANRVESQEAINRLRAKVEMHVKVLFHDLQAGLLNGDLDVTRQEALVERAVQLLDRGLHPIEEHVSVRALNNGDWMVDFAHLVDDTRIDQYHRACSGASAHPKPGCQVLVSGPWPPYHFLPAAIRKPAASDTFLYPGRRAARRSASAQAVRPTWMQAAKA